MSFISFYFTVFYELLMVFFIAASKSMPGGGCSKCA